MLSAAAAPVRLVGVSSDDNAVLIEASEPVAYAVSRPDPLTLFVDLRNVSVSDARADVERRGAVAGVRLEQASAVDGASLARVRFSLARAAEYQVRSARNTIRVELDRHVAATPDSRAREPAAMPAPAVAAPMPLLPPKPQPAGRRRSPRQHPAAAKSPRPSIASRPAARRDRRQSRSAATAQLVPARASESETMGRAGWCSIFRTSPRRPPTRSTSTARWSGRCASA